MNPAYHMEVFDIGVDGNLRVGDGGYSCPQTLSRNSRFRSLTHYGIRQIKGRSGHETYLAGVTTDHLSVI